MTKGKIVLLPFPFDDLSTAKLRPAVCLTAASIGTWWWRSSPARFLP